MALTGSTAGAEVLAKPCAVSAAAVAAVAAVVAVALLLPVMLLLPGEEPVGEDRDANVAAAAAAEVAVAFVPADRAPALPSKSFPRSGKFVTRLSLKHGKLRQPQGPGE